MIFQYTWPSVIRENKTATRRVVKTSEKAVRGRYNRIEAVYHNGRAKWEVGKTYAVQTGRGQEQIARIRLVRIRSEQVTRISSMGAVAEGFASRQDFLRVWKHIHGPGSHQLRVWVLEFELDAICMDVTSLLNSKTSALIY